MLLSDCLVITSSGLLLYKGEKGIFYIVLGGDKDGNLLLQRTP